MESTSYEAASKTGDTLQVPNILTAGLISNAFDDVYHVKSPSVDCQQLSVQKKKTSIFAP